MFRSDAWRASFGLVIRPHSKPCNVSCWLLISSLLLMGVGLSGHQLTGSLNGTSYDQTGAIVPNAKVIVKNEGSGDVRQTTSNNSGYFTVTALPPGTYE